MTQHSTARLDMQWGAGSGVKESSLYEQFPSRCGTVRCGAVWYGGALRRRVVP